MGLMKMSATSVALALLFWSSLGAISATKTEGEDLQGWYKKEESCPPPPCHECSPPPYKEEACPPPPYYDHKGPPPPYYDHKGEECPPPPSYNQECPPPPYYDHKGEECPPPPCSPPPPPPVCSPPPPVYSPPPPPPKVDCSKCTCNCEACPICEACPPYDPPKCEAPPKCDPCPVKKCDPCPKWECPKPEPCPKYDPCPEKSKCDPCDPCKYNVDGMADSDADMVNSLLDVEYVLQGYYSNAAAAGFKDGTVKKLAADFSGQTSKHISALTELLGEKADKKPESLKVNKEVYSKILSSATGKKIEQFNPYSSANNVLLGATVTAPMASALSTSMITKLQGRGSATLVAGLSSALAAQNAAVNVLLLERNAETVAKGVTVAEAVADVTKFQQKLSTLSSESGSSNTTAFEASALQFTSGSSGFAARSPSQVKTVLKELGFF